MRTDPDRMVRYPLPWPRWMHVRATEAANARAMSLATWLREAALEKLERDGSAVQRHADHGSEVICRPAGNGLCEPLR